MAHAKVRNEKERLALLKARAMRLRSIPIRDISTVVGIREDRLRELLARKGKLDHVKAKKIRALYATGKYSQRQLAKAFRVSRSCIYGVTSGETWWTPAQRKKCANTESSADCPIHRRR